MTYLASDFLLNANSYEGTNIFEDIFNYLDYENCTDYRAVFTDGSMLVLAAGKWEFEMFDEIEDDDDA